MGRLNTLHVAGGNHYPIIGLKIAQDVTVRVLLGSFFLTVDGGKQEGLVVIGNITVRNIN